MTLLDVPGVLFSGVRFLIDKDPGKLATFSTMCDTDTPIRLLKDFSPTRHCQMISNKRGRH